MELQIVKSLIDKTQKSYRQRELNKALEYANKAYEYAVDLELIEEQEEIDFLKGEILVTKATYSYEAEDENNAHAYCQQLDTSHPFTYILLGQLYTHQRAFDKSEEVLLKAKKLAIGHKKETDFLILSNTYLGLLCFENNQIEKAFEFEEIVSEIINSTDNYEIISTLKYYELALELFRETQKVEEAKKIINQLSLINEEVKDIESQFIVLISLVFVKCMTSNFKIALEYNLSAKSIADKIKSKKSIVKTHLDLGRVFKYLRDYSASEQEFRTILNKYNNIISEHERATLYVNLSTALKQLNQIDKALIFSKKAFTLSNKIQFNRHLLSSLINISTIYIEHKEDLDKFEYYNNIYENTPMTHLIPEYQIVQKKLKVTFLYKKGKFKEAEVLLLSCINQIKEFKLFRQLGHSYLELYKIYKSQKNYPKALEYHELYHKEEVNKLEVAKKKETLNLEHQYKTKEKEKEIELLKTQMSNKELELNQRISDLYLKALQSQMNPHFIFNALNGIQNFIATGEQEKAMKYLSRFAKLIRMIFEQSKTEQILLRDEIEFLELYLQLEKFRFQDKIEIDFQFDNTLHLEEIHIPPLLIQPIIENAFKHGLMHREENGKLLIRIKKYNKDQLQCIVEDNGVGRTRAKELSLKRIRGQKSAGLKTTQERLDIINNKEETTLQITDLVDNDGTGIGTKVELIIKVINKF